MKIKAILWDIDGTVLNFEASERAAIRKGFENFQLGICTDEMLEDYKNINIKYWEALERGEMTKDEILVGRFIEFFTKYGIDVSKAVPFNQNYQVDLGDTICFHDDAFALISSLKGKFLQYAVTNGTATAQHKKLEQSKLKDVLDGWFISDEIGYEKPTLPFFEPVFKEIEKKDASIQKDEILIVGDSLTSDMLGGNNCGIKCCWYNPKGLENKRNVKIDFEIDNLNDLIKIIRE